MKTEIIFQPMYDQLGLDNPDEIKQRLKNFSDKLSSFQSKLYIDDMDEDQIWGQFDLIQQPCVNNIGHELKYLESIEIDVHPQERISKEQSDIDANDHDNYSIDDNDSLSNEPDEIYYDDFYDTKEDLETVYQRALDVDEQVDDTIYAEPSTFEKFQQKMNRQIEELEEENVSEKPWTMTGEVSSKERPINSLLEEVIEFDVLTRPAPIITEQVTNDLEQRIQKRIYEELWNDPQKPTIDIKSTKTLPELSGEKSKKSLSQIYEDEYHSPVTKNNDTNTVKELWIKLSRQLEVLSHFYYVPKAEKISKTHDDNTPALMLEEAIPMFVSDSQILAPEQVYSPRSKPLKSKSEQNSIERHTQHLNKKRQQKKNNSKVPDSKVQLLRSLAKQKNVTVLK